MTNSEPTWLVFDARYHSDPDSAAVLYATDTEEDANEFAEDYPDSVVVLSGS